jgi:sugar-phosphatase
VSIHAPGLAVLEARTFEAVLFDLDGTLIDSTGSVDRSWQRWATERGFPLEKLDVPHGMPARQVLARLVRAEEVEEAFAHIEAVEVADVDGIVILPGVVEALRAIPADRAAIATSGTPPLAKARIAATGLPAPAVLVTADDVLVGKPDPAPYLLAAKLLGADPTRCLVVEDAPTGLTSARAAGCATIAVTTTHAVEELVADVVMTSLADVRFVAVDGGIRVEVAD